VTFVECVLKRCSSHAHNRSGHLQALHLPPPTWGPVSLSHYTSTCTDCKHLLLVGLFPCSQIPHLTGAAANGGSTAPAPTWRPGLAPPPPSCEQPALHRCNSNNALLCAAPLCDCSHHAQERRLEALHYARCHLAPWAGAHLGELTRALATLALGAGTKASPYR
jgi:hypothetical protein